jgi:hypothetical protein
MVGSRGRIARRGVIAAALAAGGALLACGDARAGRSAAAGAELGEEVLATLRTTGGYAVGKPTWISVDRAHRFVVADESDKNLKLFDGSGRAAGTVGRPGSGPGEFTALLGGGTIGDSLYAYDFNGTRLSLFTGEGRYARSVELGAAGTPMPASVRVIDDSLVLVAGFAIGSPERDLLRLLRRDGSPVSRFLNLRRYFTPANADLIQASTVYADGAGGTVFAGVMGLDSVFAFDYAGRRVAAGRITLPQGTLPQFRALIAANHGKRTRPDRTLVYQGLPALVAVAALDADHAVLQVMKLDYSGGGRLERTQGGTFLLATVDRRAGTITTGSARELEGGLVGRDRNRGALVARYAGADFDTIELLRLGVAGRGEGGR